MRTSRGDYAAARLHWALWKQGAAAGHSEAQWHLGRAYEDGKGTDKDWGQAYAWYRCALASAEASMKGEPALEARIAADVRKSLASLVARLSPEQHDRGRRLAAEYLAAYVKDRKVRRP